MDNTIALLSSYKLSHLQELYVQLSSTLDIVCEDKRHVLMVCENASQLLGQISMVLKHNSNPLSIPNLENMLGLCVAMWLLQYPDVRVEMNVGSTLELANMLRDLGDGVKRSGRQNMLLAKLPDMKDPNGMNGEQIRDVLIKRLAGNKNQEVLRFLDKLRLVYGRIEAKLANLHQPNAKG